jgi:hypothetical protein
LLYKRTDTSNIVKIISNRWFCSWIHPSQKYSVCHSRSVCICICPSSLLFAFSYRICINPFITRLVSWMEILHWQLYSTIWPCQYSTNYNLLLELGIIRISRNTIKGLQFQLRYKRTDTPNIVKIISNRGFCTGIHPSPSYSVCHSRSDCICICPSSLLFAFSYYTCITTLTTWHITLMKILLC